MHQRDKSNEELNAEIKGLREELASLKALCNSEIIHRSNKESEHLKGEPQYFAVLDASPDTISITDLQGNILYSSAQTLNMFGYAHPDAFRKKPLTDFIHVDDHQRALFNIEKMFQGYFPGAEEYTGIKSDGTLFPIEVNGEFIRDQEGKPERMVFVTRDISERKNAEERIEKLNRLYLVISNVNKAIVHLRDKEKLMQEICRIAIDYGKFRMAWIGLKDEESDFVRPVVANGVDDEYLSIFKQISVKDVPEGQGPTGTAIREGKLIIVNDIENDPRMSIWRADALARNFRSVISLPVKQFGQTLGALTLYSSVIHFFNSEETRLLDEIADDIGFAFESIETENERRRGEEQLRKLSRVVEQSPVSIVISDLEGNIEYVNPKATQTTGYTTEELLGENPRLLKSGETNDAEYQRLWEQITSGKEWQGIFHNKRKNGELFWESSAITPITGSNGEITHYLAIKEDITESKLAKEALIRSEANLNYAQELAGMGSWEYNLETNKVIWSKNNYRLHGFEPYEIEITNDFYLSLVYPEDLKLVNKNLSIMKDHQVTTTIDIRVVTPDGNIKWIQNHIVPLFNDDKLIGFNGVNIDINDKKIAEEELRNSEERYKALFEKNHSVILLIDPANGEIKDANPAACNFYGWAHNEICTKNISDINILSLSEVRAEMQKAVEEKVNQFFFSHRLANGEVRDVEVFSGTINIGQSHMLYSMIHDITERKRAEEEVRKFRTISDQANYGSAITSLEGIVLYINDSFAQMHGYQASELPGKHLSVFHSPEQLPRVEELLKLMKAKGSFSAVELWNTRKDGTVFPILMNASLICDSNQVPQFLSATIIDISEIKEKEKALRKSENDLNNAQQLAKLGSWEHNLVTGKLTGSQNYYRLLGLEPDEKKDNLFEYFISILHPDDLKTVEFLKQHEYVENEIQTVILRILLPGGETRWLQNNVLPVIENGRLIALSGVNIDITENKLASIALQYSEDALNNAQEMAQMGNWEYKVVTGEYTWSKNNYQLFGLKPFEIKVSVEDFLRMVHPDDKQSLIERGKRMITSGNGESLVYRVFFPDGRIRWIQDNAVPVFDGDKVIGLKGVNFDITEKKESEEQIRVQNERLNAIISAMPDLIFVIDQQGSYLELFANNPEKLLVPGNQLIGSNVKMFFDEERATLHLHKIEQCIQSRSLVTYEYSMGNDDSISFFEARLTPLGTGKVLAFVRDITERRQKDKALNKLQLAVQQSPVSIVITDLKGGIEYVNPSFESTTGYTSEEVIGKNVRILHSGKTDQAVYKDLWNTINKGLDWHGEWINKKKNGELFWERISISPIHTETGDIYNYLAVKQDITLRKQAEQEILDLNVHLEQKIEERTFELEATNLNLTREIEGRKRVQEALIESEKSYRNVVENVSEVIFQTDADGLWIFLNKSWSIMTGFSVEESIGQLFVNYVHPDDRQRNMELFEPLISRKKDYCSHEVRYLTRDGSFRWVHVYARIGLNDKDEITGTYGTLQDVTERKRAEEFENELLHLAPKLTGISPSEINLAIDMALSRIGQFLEADRSYIFEFNADQNAMSNTFEWCNTGVYAEIENLQEIPVGLFPNWMEALNAHENILIPSVEKLPESWNGEREILEPQGIKSLIVIPILTEINLIGFVGLDYVKRTKDFHISEINNLKVWSSMLASLINDQRTAILLEQTRQNYETFFNTIDDFLFVIDQQGNIIHTNNTVNDRLEFSKEELFNQSILSVHPADRREEANRIVGEMLAGVTEYCPVPIVTKSGMQIPVETRVKPGFWNGKEVIFGVSKDISQIKLSEQKFSTAFHSNSAMMAISDFFTGEYLDINNALLEKLGYTLEELIGKTNQKPDLFVDPTFRNEIIQKLLSNIPVRKLEVVLRAKSGEFRTGLISCDSIYIGERRCLLTVTLDITERKIAEEEIKKARLAAEESNLAKSEFLSRMSHELRTPMNSILGFAQLLQMGDLLPRQRTGVNHILHSGKHLLDLINEVLDISRIEAGRISLSLEPVQLNTIIHEIIDSVHPLVTARRLKLELVSSPANQLFVRCDRQRLKQVIMNLMSNAIKYDKEGGSVTITTQQMPVQESGYLPIRISITDTGLGISAEDIPKLFKPFERIGAEKTQTEGTGLGLAVVKKLMDAMGGTIGVESTPGVGSTFWIELPQSKSQLETIEDSVVLQGIEPIPAISQGTILYIEDNVSNIELIEQILSAQRSNIRLISNMNGKQAVQLAINYNPDLILLDLNLPDIHGLEVIKLLQSEEKTKAIPVVVISADAMPKQIEKLFLAGARNYLTKPLDIPAFLLEVDKWTSVDNPTYEP